MEKKQRGLDIGFEMFLDFFLFEVVGDKIEEPGNRLTGMNKVIETSSAGGGGHGGIWLTGEEINGD